MKQNELFNKCCENIDPKTREEVWKQMDKELGREENRGNSSKIPSNSPKKELEQAAGDYIVQLNGEDLEGGFNAAFNAFKAGALWQKKQDDTITDAVLKKFADTNYELGYKAGIEWQKKQKSEEWSEEDEAMRDNILRLLSCFVGTSECDSNPSLSTSYPTYYKEIDWLKSLRPQPQRVSGNPEKATPVK